MREFKYDVVKLIHAIRDRPCLWDKTIDSYKDRVERRSAWEEIFNMLEERYEQMTAEEKRITGEIILNKWTNIRDTFMKSLKSKLGRPKRRYVLYHHLKFLTKLRPAESDIDQVEFMEDCNEDIAYGSPMKEEAESQSSEPSKQNDFDHTNSNVCTIEASYSQKKKSKRNEFDNLKVFRLNESRHCRKKSKRFSVEMHDSIDSNSNKKKSKSENSNTDVIVNNEIDFVQVDETDDPRVMNEDEAFFASLLPTIVRYSEDERLEFRIEVLKVMKKINDERKCFED